MFHKRISCNVSKLDKRSNAAFHIEHKFFSNPWFVSRRSLIQEWIADEMLIYDCNFRFYLVGELGHCLLATEPKILFCDLKLAPGETQTCKFISVFFLFH